MTTDIIKKNKQLSLVLYSIAIFGLFFVSIACYKAQPSGHGVRGHWLVELFRYMPYPIYMIPGLFFSLFGLVKFRSAYLLHGINLTSLAICSIFLMGFSFGTFKFRNEDGNLTVMTYNIKSRLAEEKQDGYQLLVEEIEKQNPDFIAMQDAQEVTPPNDIPVDLQKMFNKGYQTYLKDQFVVASKYPIKRCDFDELRPAVFTEFVELGLVMCVIDFKGTMIVAATTHLLSPRTGMNALRTNLFNGGFRVWANNHSRRFMQAIEVENALYIARKKYKTEFGKDVPVMLMGDFNAPESSSVIQSIIQPEKFKDVFSRISWGFGFTHGKSLRPYIDLSRIDHIFVSEDIAVVESHTGGSEASDHRPVIARLKINQ